MRLLVYNARFMPKPCHLRAPYHAPILALAALNVAFLCSAAFRALFGAWTLLGVVGAVACAANHRNVTGCPWRIAAAWWLLAWGVLIHLPVVGTAVQWLLFLGVFCSLGVAIVWPTANLFLHLVSPEYTNERWDERMDTLVSRLGDYDVVCLQEMFSIMGLDRDVCRLRRCAASKGLTHFYSTGRWPWFPAIVSTDGLVILSRYPIECAVTVPFRRQSVLDTYVTKRAVVMARLTVGGTPVSLMNIHLTSGNEFLFSSFGIQTVDDHGAGELATVLAAFRQFADDGGLRIACGDFNIDRSGPKYARLQRMLQDDGLSNAWPDCPPTFGRVDEASGRAAETFFTDSVFLGKQSVYDYVFASRPAQPRGQRLEEFKAPPSARGWQQVSDHVGVAVQFAA